MNSSLATGVSQPVSTREINSATLCRYGQEMVQEIMSRMYEVFYILKIIQPPSGTYQSHLINNDRKNKIHDNLKMVKLLFRKLRYIYDKCIEGCKIQGMEYLHIETLIPLADEIPQKPEETKYSDIFIAATEEGKEVREQVMLRNTQLKEVIDHLRNIIYEINTMIATRKT